MLYLIIIAIILIVLYLCIKREGLTLIRKDNSEFRGINMLGVNSEDGFFPAGCEEECIHKCLINKDCKGYSYYVPGQRCYLFSTGNFIDNDQGFKAGMKA